MDKTTKKHVLIDTYCKNIILDDKLIVCCSGGGSACLALPIPEISISEKLEFIQLLAGNGADIEDLNRLRGRLSQVKSGRLLQKCFPAKISTFILSDIIGDPAHLIASGPTIPFEEKVDVKKILHKYKIEPTEKIKKCLAKNIPPRIEENADFQIVGKNKIILDDIKNNAENLGIDVVTLGETISGEASTIGKIYSDVARFLRNSFDEQDLKKSLETAYFPEDTLNKILSITIRDKPIILVAGGEPTVTLTGHGKGKVNIKN